MSSIRLRQALAGALILLGLLGAVPRAHAQLGGLIRKKLDKTTAKQAAGPPTVYTDIVLELTPERVAQVIAGKNAGKRIAESPNGPAALRKKLEPIDNRQFAIYGKHVAEINAWDMKRREIEACRDSILGERQEAIRAQFMTRARTDMAFVQKMTELGQAMQTAAQKGDTALQRKLAKDLDNLKGAPSRADTLVAEKACRKAEPPAAVQEYLTLTEQKNALEEEIRAAEEAISKAEEQASTLNRRQLFIACERILLYLDRELKKSQQSGFSTTEIAALEQQKEKLKKLCD